MLKNRYELISKKKRIDTSIRTEFYMFLVGVRNNFMRVNVIYYDHNPLVCLSIPWLEIFGG